MYCFCILTVFPPSFPPSLPPSLSPLSPSLPPLPPSLPPSSPSQLCLFAEGTRFTKEKHDVSVAFAKEKGLPILKHHLHPRPKGFTFLVNNLKETSTSLLMLALIIAN